SQPLEASQSWNVRRTGSSSSTRRIVSGMSVHRGTVGFPRRLKVAAHQVGHRLYRERVGAVAQCRRVAGLGDRLVPVAVAGGLAGGEEMIGSVRFDREKHRQVRPAAAAGGALLDSRATDGATEVQQEALRVIRAKPQAAEIQASSR